MAAAMLTTNTGIMSSILLVISPASASLGNLGTYGRVICKVMLAVSSYHRWDARMGTGPIIITQSRITPGVRLRNAAECTKYGGESPTLTTAALIMHTHMQAVCSSYLRRYLEHQSLRLPACLPCIAWSICRHCPSPNEKQLHIRASNVK
jgi:hypothetical protein